MDIEAVVKTIVNCAYEVKRVLGSGFLESVYQNALIHELNKQGLKTEKEKTLTVFYKNIPVGCFRTDIIVEDSVIIETKVTDSLTKENEYQLVNYLTATGIITGLLINFGNRLEIKRKYMNYNKTSNEP